MPRIRVTLNGGLGTGNPEKWSTSLNYSTALIATPSQAQNIADDIRDMFVSDWAGSWTDLKGLLSNRGSLTHVDVYAYDGSGPAIASGFSALSTPLVGTTVCAMPPQACAVFSLLTTLPGPHRRGRNYWPALGASIGADLKSSTAKNAGEDFVELAGAIAAASTVWTPAIWSVYSPTLEVLTPVSRVRAGDVVDTQRRRRDALVETYTITSV